MLDGDDWTNSSTILKGCFNQFFKIKKQNRHLKILLSIGGWTYSGGLSEATCLPERRKNFATSAVKLLKELGLDGLDVDWEYPENWDQAYQYVELLRELRAELDAYSKRLGLPIDQFELTVAAPAGPVQYHQMAIRAMDPFLSFWNLMCYDYAGSWSSTSQYHSNLYNGELSTDKAIKFYINAGVHPSKIVLGMPLYGRAFPNTDGLGRPYSGEFVGSYETDTWDYKSIPREGEKLDSSAMAVYKYDERTRMLITYDNEVVSKAKADYVVKNGLGGGMWWESSADMPITSNQSLIGTFTNQIGLEKLDKRKNCLFYPESPYQNLRNITI